MGKWRCDRRRVGIGRAVTSRRLIEEGARVGVMERRDPGRPVRSEFGDAVIGIAGDVASLQTTSRAVAETSTRLRQARYFVGNAGIFDVMLGSPSCGGTSCRTLMRAVRCQRQGCIFGAKAACRLTKTSGALSSPPPVGRVNSGGGGALYTARSTPSLAWSAMLAVELAPVRVQWRRSLRHDHRICADYSRRQRRPSAIRAPGMPSGCQAGIIRYTSPWFPPTEPGSIVFLASRKQWSRG